MTEKRYYLVKLLNLSKKILLIFILQGICCIPNIFAEQIIGSGCSVSNVGYLSAIANEYERITGRIVLVRGGGSVVGLEDLKAGRVDFAASCKTLSHADSKDIESIQVAWDALVFIVHKSNPVNSISLDDVRNIYSYKVKNWKELNGYDMPIKVYRSMPLKGLSGVDESTIRMVFGGKQYHPSPNTIQSASTGIVEQMVEKNKDAFATTGFSSAKKRDVKMLKLDGILPTKNNIISGRYPLKRPLFILITKNAKPGVKNFVEFILSTKGQKFISSQGLVSLTDIKKY